MSEIPARLSMITLGTRDLPRLRAFYQRLGWAEVPGSGDGWAAYVLGGAALALFPIDALAEEAAATSPAPGGWSGVTLACNVDGPERVDAAVAAAAQAGAVVVAPPSDRPWGGRSGYVADPEGNRWEIAWAPQATFDERGALLAFGA